MSKFNENKFEVYLNTAILNYNQSKSTALNFLTLFKDESQADYQEFVETSYFAPALNLILQINEDLDKNKVPNLKDQDIINQFRNARDKMVSSIYDKFKAENLQQDIKKYISTNLPGLSKPQAKRLKKLLLVKKSQKEAKNIYISTNPQDYTNQKNPSLLKKLSKSFFKR